MRLNDRIKQVREDLGLTIQEVYDRCVAVLGSKSISYRTLQRIERGKISKFASILKICCALGISLEELLQGTDMEQSLVVRKKERLDEYTYNEKVHASVVSSPSCSFLALELSLQPKGKTQTEQSPEGNFEKWIYVIEGELTCYVRDEKYVLKSKDSISFKSSVPHHLENNGKKTCICTILQNPKHF